MIVVKGDSYEKLDNYGGVQKGTIVEVDYIDENDIVYYHDIENIGSQYSFHIYYFKKYYKKSINIIGQISKKHKV